MEILDVVDIFFKDRLAVVSSLEYMVRVTDCNCYLWLLNYFWKRWGQKQVFPIF